MEEEVEITGYYSKYLAWTAGMRPERWQPEILDKFIEDLDTIDVQLCNAGGDQSDHLVKDSQTKRRAEPMFFFVSLRFRNAATNDDKQLAVVSGMEKFAYCVRLLVHERFGKMINGEPPTWRLWHDNVVTVSFKDALTAAAVNAAVSKSPFPLWLKSSVSEPATELQIQGPFADLCA